MKEYEVDPITYPADYSRWKLVGAIVVIAFALSYAPYVYHAITHRGPTATTSVAPTDPRTGWVGVFGSSEFDKRCDGTTLVYLHTVGGAIAVALNAPECAPLARTHPAETGPAPTGQPTTY